MNDARSSGCSIYLDYSLMKIERFLLHAIEFLGHSILHALELSQLRDRLNDALGALRVKLGEDRGMVAEGWQPLWVIDFPMFEKDKQTKQYGMNLSGS